MGKAANQPEPTKVDISSLVNEPSLLCCGGSVVLMWIPNSRNTQAIRRILAILRELNAELGDLVATYPYFCLHVTIGKILGTTYTKPGQRLDTLDEYGHSINIAAILAAVRDSRPFTIEFYRVGVNQRGEILLFGNAAETDGSDVVLTKLRGGLMEEADLPISTWDREGNTHSCLGFLREMPPNGQLKKAMNAVEKLTAEWQADGGPILKIHADSVRAIQYSCRSCRSGPYVELPLGGESGLTGADVRSTILDDVEPIFLDLDRCVSNWLTKKMAIWTRLNPDGDAVARREELVAMARGILGQGDDFLADV